MESDDYKIRLESLKGPIGSMGNFLKDQTF